MLTKDEEESISNLVVIEEKVSFERIDKTENKDNHKRGTIAELKAAMYLESCGCIAYIPIYQVPGVDLIFFLPGSQRPIRCQVKSTCYVVRSNCSGNLKVKLSTTGAWKKYKAENSTPFDVLICVTHEGTIYMIPAEVTRDYGSDLTLTNDYDKYIVCQFRFFSKEEALANKRLGTINRRESLTNKKKEKKKLEKLAKEEAEKLLLTIKEDSNIQSLDLLTQFKEE